jgi:hypothetical protein
VRHVQELRLGLQHKTKDTGERHARSPLDCITSPFELLASALSVIPFFAPNSDNAPKARKEQIHISAPSPAQITGLHSPAQVPVFNFALCESGCTQQAGVYAKQVWSHASALNCPPRSCGQQALSQKANHPLPDSVCILLESLRTAAKDPGNLTLQTETSQEAKRTWLAASEAITLLP